MNYHNVEFERSFGTYSQLGRSDLPEIVFAGRSNVGKSSMINKLFNRKNLARVSAVPGKTATINFFRLENLRFVDLPGYGYAKVSKSEKRRWSELIGGYFADERDVALVFSLIDMRHPPTADDRQMVDFLIEHEFPFVCVLTKADKLGKTAREERLQKIRQELPCGDQLTLIPFSAETGEGVGEIRGILDEISQDVAEESGEEGEAEE
ncbi:ribosome biogenesis GTP-binding protein YihA/YsxC [Harryflintia acetispora]|uniref:ribosome biogenesis GTP-binding protein YihA/YsxC n=1 Tax=Harryflintia acetispora TaxID=1849041 RepID=UPI00189B1C20|nr:ribosome biogenesis GTP-binding protein YihA/YsxC [Harryflintia acetispora]